MIKLERVKRYFIGLRKIDRRNLMIPLVILIITGMIILKRRIL